MKKNDDNKISPDEKVGVKTTNRVFARLLGHPLTQLDTTQVSGGLGTPAGENGRWYVTNNEKFRGMDWEPN
jgi:hypothetical protein